MAHLYIDCFVSDRNISVTMHEHIGSGIQCQKKQQASVLQLLFAVVEFFISSSRLKGLLLFRNACETTCQAIRNLETIRQPVDMFNSSVQETHRVAKKVRISEALLLKTQ